MATFVGASEVALNNTIATDSCEGVSGLTRYVVIDIPPGAYHSTTPCFGLIDREKVFLLGSHSTHTVAIT